MSNENKQTVEVYKQNASKYLNTSAEHDKLDEVKANRKKEKLENFIKTGFSTLPENSKILEIGCGDGTNSKFIKDLGFEVTANDVADDFIKIAKDKGLKTAQFDALEYSFPEKYNGVFCWRVFVHFTKEDAEKIISKVCETLEEDGVFIFNAMNRETKKVDGEWVDFSNEYHLGVERYYSYFRKEDLDNIISKTKFEIKDFHKEGGDENNKWLVYVLKKNNSL